MTDILLIGIILLAVLMFGLAAFIVRKLNQAILREPVTKEIVGQLLRAETELMRRASDDQARGIRQELAERLKGFQDTSIKSFGVLNDAVNTQNNAFGERLDSGMKTVEKTVAEIGNKLNADMAQMGIDATKNRDTLRQTIEGKLDAATAKQSEDAKGLRDELGSSFQRLGGNIDATLTSIGEQQKERLDATTQALNVLSEKHQNAQEALKGAVEGQLDAIRLESAERLKGFQDTSIKSFGVLNDAVNTQITAFGERLDSGMKAVEKKVAEIGEELNADIAQMGVDATKNRDTLRQTIEGKLDSATAKQSEDAKGLRDELGSSFQRLGGNISATLTSIGEQQKERLDATTKALNSLSEKHQNAQEALKSAVEGRLDVIRLETAAKLEEMRQTVDEKLHATLETRLGESFTRVVEQLNRVHEGLGEMKLLASNVGDLKSVLTNVKVRGTFGEVQLELILEQFLTCEQYVKNARIKPNTGEQVEFAIKLPGKGTGEEVLIPIDAKFPREIYERLVEASEIGDEEAVKALRKQLETQIRLFAKDIATKYIYPPVTTEFAILFLPTEGLYAEALRRVGLFEGLQREFKVTLAGPTTLSAILNALQMGFRSLAIEKRSGEVWKILGAVQSEFKKYNDVVDRLGKQLSTAASSVDALGTRTRAMSIKLKSVESLPIGAETSNLLGFDEQGVDALSADAIAPPASATSIVITGDE